MNNPEPSVITVSCVICEQSIPFQEATAGSLYADGSQAFACNTHITERSRWTMGWITFDAREASQHETTTSKSA